MGIKDNRKIVVANSGVTMRLVSFTEVYSNSKKGRTT